MAAAKQVDRRPPVAPSGRVVKRHLSAVRSEPFRRRLKSPSQVGKFRQQPWRRIHARSNNQLDRTYASRIRLPKDVIKVAPVVTVFSAGCTAVPERAQRGSENSDVRPNALAGCDP